MNLFRVVTRNLGWKLFSLAIAVLIWILVASEPELSTFRAVPIEYTDLPEDLEITSTIVDSVYLELHGASSDLRDFGDSRRPAVILDMSHVHPGVQTFTLGNANVVLPRGVRLVRSIPAQLRFEFEHVRSRSVPVEVHFSTGPQPGYEIASYTVTPSSLTIAGPESQLSRIRSAVTDPVDLSSVVGAAEFRVHTFVDDPHVRFETPPDVIVRVIVKRLENGAKTRPPG